MDLRKRLAQDRLLLAPGIYDALTGLVAEQAGAEAVYLSGASIAYTRFGRPDIGLVGMSEVADVIAAIRDRIKLPMIVDADTGYGNALNVQRTVRTFERMGANVIQLEDQSLPKRCGHLAGKTLVPGAEMVIAANKKDLLSDSELEEVLSSCEIRPDISTSAKENDNVEDLFNMLASKLLAAHES